MQTGAVQGRRWGSSEEAPDFFPLRRFLVPIFFAPRESLQDSAVLTDIQSSFWTP